VIAGLKRTPSAVTAVVRLRTIFEENLRACGDSTYAICGAGELGACLFVMRTARVAELPRLMDVKGITGLPSIEASEDMVTVGEIV
jgi:hypothetical protein